MARRARTCAEKRKKRFSHGHIFSSQPQRGQRPGPSGRRCWPTASGVTGTPCLGPDSSPGGGVGPGDRQAESLPCAARCALRVPWVHWPRPAADAGRPRASTLLKNEPKGFKVGALGANFGALGSNMGALGSNEPLDESRSSNPLLRSPSLCLAAAWAHRPATRPTRIVESSLTSARKDETALRFRIAPRAYRPATADGGTPAASAKRARAPKAMRRKRRSSRRPMPAAACSAGAWRPLAPLAPDDRSGGSGSAGSTSWLSARHTTRCWRGPAPGQPCRRKGVSSRRLGRLGLSLTAPARPSTQGYALGACWRPLPAHGCAPLGGLTPAACA